MRHKAGNAAGQLGFGVIAGKQFQCMGVGLRERVRHLLWHRLQQMCQIDIGDPPCEVARHDRPEIGKDRHREMLLGKADDIGAEAGVAAGCSTIARPRWVPRPRREA